MRDDGALRRRDRKAGGRRGDAKHTGKATGRCRARTASDDSRDHERDRRPQRRLALGGEIEDDAEAERDRQPGHQPARADLGQRPFADAAGGAAQNSARPSSHAGAGRRPAAPQGRHAAVRPRDPTGSTMRGNP